MVNSPLLPPSGRTGHVCTLQEICSSAGVMYSCKAGQTLALPKRNFWMVGLVLVLERKNWDDFSQKQPMLHDGQCRR